MRSRFFIHAFSEVGANGPHCPLRVERAENGEVVWLSDDEGLSSVEPAVAEQLALPRTRGETPLPLAEFEGKREKFKG
jgi:hypothetical protein